MLSIGWVIFWKSVVVAVWAALVIRWQQYRENRKADGLPLRLDRRTGRYVVRDWTVHVDRGGQWAKIASFTLIFSTWAILGGTYLIGGRDAARSLVLWVFF